MSYRQFYLTAKDIADKIRSGEFKQEQSVKRDNVPEVQSGMVRRRVAQQQAQQEEQASATQENFYNDMVAKYLVELGPMGQAVDNRGNPPSWYGDTDYSGVSLSSEDVDLGSIAVGIREAADELGISAVDLATVISYETGGTFNPTQAGPTTQWGQHRGLIQFGEPQAEQYGVNWSDPYGSQLGRDGAVVKYLRDRGVVPGMSLLDVYSTVNAGAPGLYDRSDANNGGAPGTVRDKVEKQMGGHYKKALALIEGSRPQPRPTRG
jgi:hypothetical protein